MSERVEQASGMRIARVGVFLYRAPVVPPIQASFGLIVERSSLLVRVDDDEGYSGWGEVWSGMPAFGVVHRGELLVRLVAPAMRGRTCGDIGAFVATLRDRLLPVERLAGEAGPVSQVLAGVDCALWDLAAKRQGVPLYRLLGGISPVMSTYASGIAPGVGQAGLDVFRAQGFRAFKLKAGFDDGVTLRQIDALTRGLARDEAAMVDANCGWEVAAARHAIDALADTALEWIEEPVGPEVADEAWKSLAGLARQPLAGGENLLSAERFMSSCDWLGVIQPDLGKWGGVSGVVPLARQVLARGLRFCPHTFGTHVGAAHAAHVLAAVGGNGRLELDVNANPLRILSADDFPAVREGLLTLGEGPGIGIAVTPEALRPYLYAEHQID